MFTYSRSPQPLENVASWTDGSASSLSHGEARRCSLTGRRKCNELISTWSPAGFMLGLILMLCLINRHVLFG